MFSDTSPSSVFPDTEWGRAEARRFIAEDFDILNGTVSFCSEYEKAEHPIRTDDDIYRHRDIPPCGRRKRDGVRDKNWCCRCPVGFPHLWLTKRDADGLRDTCSLTF